MPVNARHTTLMRALAWSMASYLVLAIIGFALRRTDYSHLSNTISELGEFGARDSALVSWGVFFPVGVAAAVLCVVLVRARERAAAMLAGSITAGYIVASFFPCDPGAPPTGSDRNAIHMWGGAIEYFGGAAALLWMARHNRPMRWIFVAAGIVVLLVAIGLSVPDLHNVRGLIQRCGEACLFGAVILEIMRRV